MECFLLSDSGVGDGQKLFLPENSEIRIFAIFLVRKGNFFLLKKGMYQPGPGFEFGLTEKLGRCKKS